MSDGSQGAGGHDPTGLDLARSVASALRGLGRRRAGGDSARRSRRGGPQVSGAFPDARDPAPVGSLVDKLVTDSGWQTEVAVHDLFTRWAEIVGSDIASHCVPERYDDGVVSVRTASTAWATQLRVLAPTVVRRLNEELGHGAVEHVEVQGPEVPSWRRGRRTVRGGRGPRDTYG